MRSTANAGASATSAKTPLVARLLPGVMARALPPLMLVQIAGIASALQAPGEGIPTGAIPPAGPLTERQVQEMPTELTGEFLTDPDSLRVGVVRLTWTLPARRGSQQRVLLATRDIGFLRGDYDMSIPLRGDETTFLWSPLGGVRTVYWKVQTLQPTGWVDSEVAITRRELLEVESDALVATEPSPVVPPLNLGVSPCATIFADINPDSSNGDATDPDRASGGRVNGLATVSGDNQTYYGATEWGGLYKTGDGGLTWDRLTGHMPMVTWDVEVDPSNAQIVYATSAYDGRVNTRAGIQVSSNAGGTWGNPASARPILAGPGDNTPQAGFACAAAAIQQISAFGIGIRPDASQNVFIGTSCGLAISNDSGANWQFVDPQPTPGTADTVFDVVVQAGGQGIVDVVSSTGHHRSTDGGTTWSANAATLPAAAYSNGAQIAVSPDESYVIFIAGGDLQLYESDDAGATWTNLGAIDPSFPNGGGARGPVLATNAKTAGFDLWTGIITLWRAPCTTPNPPAQGGANRCPTSSAVNWFGGFTRSGLGNATGAHDDIGDIVFDSQTAVDAVPRILSTDGGVYRATTTSVSPTGTANLVWEQPNRAPHALWAFGFRGVRKGGDATEDLYMMCQDNGTFGTTMGGAASPGPSWNNNGCCDGFDVGAEDDTALYIRGFQPMGRGFRLYLSNPGLVTNAEINTYPAGGLVPAFNFAESIDTWGDDRYAVLMNDCTNQNGCPGAPGGSDGGLFITTDITVNPIVWTELGNGTEPNSAQMVDLQVALDGGGIPTFYVQVGGGNGLTADQLWRFVGTNPAGTWTRIDNNIPGGTGVFRFGANRSDPARLYAAGNIGAGPRMFSSINGGAGWQADTNLDNLMQGGGTFLYQNTLGQQTFAGYTGFGGYPQPSLIAFDPTNPELLVAGSRDAGVFISRNGGNRWGLLTDPFNSAASGVPHIPRPWFAHFDHDTGDANRVHVYIGSQGFGTWRITVPIDVPVATVPGDVSLPVTCVGSFSTATLDVCNTGSATCENLEIFDITSTNPQFQVIEPTSGYPIEISPDFCFPFQLRFTPTAMGPQSATITVMSNDPEAPLVAVQASSTGGVRNIQTLIADSGNYGDVCVETFRDLDLLVNNAGLCDLSITDVSSSNPRFQTASVLSYPILVASGTTIRIPIRFDPIAFGAQAGTISVSTNDPGTPTAQVSVNGNAPPGDIAFTGSTDFGDVCPGEQAKKTVTICNTGPCNLDVTSVAFDPPCADFQLVNNPFPAVLSEGACLDVVILFTPTSVGFKSCTLKVLSNDPDEPVLTHTVTGNVPVPMIDVPPDLTFAPEVIQSVGPCSSDLAFPISNTGRCNLIITDVSIVVNQAEYSLVGLPSYPIILEPGHIVGEGNLAIRFSPQVIGRNRTGQVRVTYESDPITGATMAITRNLCGEGVNTGARVLVTHAGNPLNQVKKIQLHRVNANQNGSPLDTIDVIQNAALATVSQGLPCSSFQYQREYGGVSNPVLLLPGSYRVTVTARINGHNLMKRVGFDVSTCDFNQTINVNFP